VEKIHPARHRELHHLGTGKRSGWPQDEFLSLARVLAGWRVVAGQDWQTTRRTVTEEIGGDSPEVAENIWVSSYVL